MSSQEDGDDPGEAPVTRRGMVRSLQAQVLGLLALTALPLAFVHRHVPLACGAALVASAVGALGARAARRDPGGLGPGVGLAIQLGLCVLLVVGVLAGGGAADPALSLAFVPGFFAILLLGARPGLGVAAVMLLGMGVVYVSAPPTERLDQIRFFDEVVMTLFAAAFAYTLGRCFDAEERLIAGRRDSLKALGQARVRMARAIYEELSPQASALVAELDCLGPVGETGKAVPGGLVQATLRLSQTLREAKALTHAEGFELGDLGHDEFLIRRDAMRLWLRLGIAFVLVFAVRNLVVGAPFAPTLVSGLLCVGLDLWLGRHSALRHMEAAALAIGLGAGGPLFLLIQAYDAGAHSPPLVVTPATVLFTTLLSRGPAAFIMVAVNLGILVFAANAGPLDVFGTRLLGDLVIVFVGLVFALRFVMAVRREFALAIARQAGALLRAVRQHRRLAGTLFHDANNQLQALLLYSELRSERDAHAARSLGLRVQRLIGLSKAFLADGDGSVALVPVPLRHAFELAREAYWPQLEAKQIHLELKVAEGERAFAEPALLIESVLGNLVSNAVKFSPIGGAVCLRAERKDDEVHIVVSDQGPGFPDAVLLGLEDPEGRAPSATGSAGEAGQGYGIGLAREHALRMGGRLWLSNRPGGGAECLLSLPRAPAEGS